MVDSDELVRLDDLAIRRMRDEPADYALMLRWRTQPHVAEWWNTDDDALDRIVEHYRPNTDRLSKTTAAIITFSDRPIGYTQFYRWSDYADEMRAMGFSLRDEAFGLDILIGEPDLIDLGLGSRAVALLCSYLFNERGATAVALTTAESNVRAQRAYEKAGMTTIGRCLDTDTMNGERIPSLLMAIERPRLPS